MSLTARIHRAIKSTVAIGSFTANDPGQDYLDNGYYNIYRKAYGAYVGSLGMYMTDQRAMSTAAVFACVKIISEDVGSLPLFLYRRGDNDDRQPATDEPLYSLLHDGPNPDMTALEFREALTGHALLGGQGFAKIERRGGKLTALWLMMPYEVTVDVDQRGRRVFIWKQGNSAQQTLTSKDVLHLKGFGLTGTEGLNLMIYAARTLGLMFTYEEYASRFFSQDQTPNLVLKHPGKLSPLAVQEVKDAWERTGKAQDKWHRPRVLTEGMGVEQLSPDNQKSQLIEQRSFQLLEVCRLFRMPPHKLAELGRATWGNLSEQNTQYYNETLRPWLVRWEQAIQRCCLWDQPNLYAEHSIEAFLRGDYETQTVGITRLVGSGLLSRNEARRMFNLNNVENGDEFYVPLNWQEVLDAANAATAARRQPNPQPGTGLAKEALV